MNKPKNNDAMYTGEACPKCGSTQTLAIGAGSVWCPDEDAHPGGYWVRRVAFAQPPKRDANGDWVRNTPPQRIQRQPVARIASTPTSKPVRVAKPADEWAPSTHDFVETK